MRFLYLLLDPSVSISIKPAKPVERQCLKQGENPYYGVVDRIKELISNHSKTCSNSSLSASVCPSHAIGAQFDPCRVHAVVLSSLVWLPGEHFPYLKI